MASRACLAYTPFLHWHKHIEPDRNEQAVLKRIHRLEGMSLRAIAAELNRRRGRRRLPQARVALSDSDAAQAWRPLLSPLGLGYPRVDRQPLGRITRVADICRDRSSLTP